MKRTGIAAAVLAVLLATWLPALAQPVAVRFAEGVARGFPVLRGAGGERLAHGDLVQVPRGDRIENRMVFHFRDGSVYDERVVFSQNGVFTVHAYSLVQRGPSFPESLEARIDRDTGRYHVRHRADPDAAEEVLEGRIDLPQDVYNGLLTTLIKNLEPGASARVQIVAFTPKPRLVTMLLAPAVEEHVTVGEVALPATRYRLEPQLGLLASFLIADVPVARCWIAGGEAPGFLRFEGPLFFMGPVWRIEPS
jgi:hypothetical protein